MHLKHSKQKLNIVLALKKPLLYFKVWQCMLHKHFCHLCIFQNIVALEPNKNYLNPQIYCKKDSYNAILRNLFVEQLNTQTIL